MEPAAGRQRRRRRAGPAATPEPEPKPEPEPEPAVGDGGPEATEADPASGESVCGGGRAGSML